MLIQIKHVKSALVEFQTFKNISKLLKFAATGFFL